MKLLTKRLKQALPPLYATEWQKDPLVVCKFFLPGTGWAWYPTEFDGKDTFFGYVEGLYNELGYFSLLDFKQTAGPLGLKVERDEDFEPVPLSQVRK